MIGRTPRRTFPAYLTRKAAEKIAQSVGCRLPTETEWEYACRANTKSLFIWGDDCLQTTSWNHGSIWSSRASGRAMPSVSRHYFRVIGAWTSGRSPTQRMPRPSPVFMSSRAAVLIFGRGRTAESGSGACLRIACLQLASLKAGEAGVHFGWSISCLSATHHKHLSVSRVIQSTAGDRNEC